MTGDKIEYEESDDRFTDFESEEVSLSDAISENCYNCDATLAWVLDPDPDSLTYRATCDQCDWNHAARPTKAVVNVYEPEE